jgi:predicted CXXCH cytochrome family protein
VFGGKIAISRSYLLQIEKVSLHQAHTEGLPDPRDTKRTITCVTCHVPHGGGKGLLITGTTRTENLCLDCHSLNDL